MEKSEMTDYDLHPDHYVDLVKIAERTNCYEGYVMQCNLIGVYPGSREDYDNYKCFGGCCSSHIHPYLEYLTEKEIAMYKRN